MLCTLQYYVSKNSFILLYFIIQEKKNKMGVPFLSYTTFYKVLITYIKLLPSVQ